MTRCPICDKLNVPDNDTLGALCMTCSGEVDECLAEMEREDLDEEDEDIY